MEKGKRRRYTEDDRAESEEVLDLVIDALHIRRAQRGQVEHHLQDLCKTRVRGEIYEEFGINIENGKANSVGANGEGLRSRRIDIDGDLDRLHLLFHNLRRLGKLQQAQLTCEPKEKAWRSGLKRTEEVGRRKERQEEQEAEHLKEKNVVVKKGKD